MNILDEINNLPREMRRPNECKTCWLLSNDGETRVAVDKALVGGTAPGALAAVLARNGYDVTTDNLQKHHRRGHTA